jgi:adenylate cyclase
MQARREGRQARRYSSFVSPYSRKEAAERAGVSVDDLSRLVDLGILEPAEGDRFSIGDVRRVVLLQSFTAAGIPLDGLATQMRKGDLSLAWLDSPAFDAFASLSPVTFAQLSAQTGVPVDLLMVIREAIGSALPTAEDRVREDEMAVVPLIEAQVKAGLKHSTIERALRAIGDSMRRVAEVEMDWFRTELIEPRAAGKYGAEISAIAVEFRERFDPLSDQARLAIFHAHQAHAVTSNVIGGFEAQLAAAGLTSRLERPPAMCFLDITGYTRLTQERGDAAAADLAEQLGRLVHRTSVKHGGRPVKWLGDGVMFFFRDAGPGVAAALEMVDSLAEAGLPPAHVGLHAGPVIFQEGDYYGQTVNVASRIAEYARPGEVVVSQVVVDTSAVPGVSFVEIGPVELKGVVGAMRLHAAHRSPT